MTPAQQDALLDANRTADGQVTSGPGVRATTLRALQKAGLVTIREHPDRARPGYANWGRTKMSRSVIDRGGITATLTPAGRQAAVALGGPAWIRCVIEDCTDLRLASQTELRCAYHAHRHTPVP